MMQHPIPQMWGFKNFSAWVPVLWLSIKIARRRDEQESGDSRNAKVLGCRDGPTVVTGRAVAR